MAIVVMGLGNPGKEYEKTRHNAGRMAVQAFAKAEGLDDFNSNKKAEALVSEGSVEGEKVVLVLPETYMNKSGKSAQAVVKSVKAAKQLIVVRDDLDLPIGVTKMTYARGAGGHKGVESIMRAIKTDAFVQLKIGISAPALRSARGAGAKGKRGSSSAKATQDKEEKVLKHVIGKFKPAEETAVKKSLKKSAGVIRTFIASGLEDATMEANTR